MQLTQLASHFLPRSIASRLYLILFTGLLVAHGLSFALLFYERYQTAMTMMLGSLKTDVATAITVLDRTPNADRESLLPVLERRTYRYILGSGEPGDAPLSERAQRVTRLIASVLGDRYPVHANTISTYPEKYQIHLTLSDGTPLTIEVTPSLMPIARWLPFVLAIQVALLLLCTWFAVRLATRPLAHLAHAAETLDPGKGGQHLQEDGPTEVAKAATAFNAMQDRIARHLQERLQILAAISHDLQTPITRMKLRTEGMADLSERDKLTEDLDQMQHLVREGVAYARSVHGDAEQPRRLDIDAFLDSLVYDYQDTGKPVTLAGHLGVTMATRPQALRRILGNLIDNAIKYAGAAELLVERGSDKSIRITIQDRGPGIPESALESVMQPFYRLEGSRSRDTGGAGLGLAIAQQLTLAIGGSLSLRNRPDGGLQASVEIREA
ncbi:ATP-binding protein [Dongia soli]|uniref:histidine kinase n=1 Tax=Dongia soli TaxID=600628 RepID=A0ABU5EG28_9PROT|nr:ATP-binding protein [Dongia soli]MDY0885370.1 ATP-binding protein [Dongia soli]